MNTNLNPRKFLVVEGWVVALLAVAFFVPRFIFLNLIKSDPAFQMPIIDSLEFDIWACEILSGRWVWSSIQNHTPLYPYVLAFSYKILGYSVVKAVIVQYFIGFSGCLLLYTIVKRIANRSVAIIASLLLSSYWFMIYVQSFLFCETISMVLNLLLVYILLFFNDHWKKYVWAGIVFGLSVLCRPDIGVFSMGVGIWLFMKRFPLKTLCLYYLLFIATFLVILGPVVWQNYRIDGSFPLLRSQAGANFYMGNHPSFKGTAIHLEIGKDWDEFISQPSQELKRNAKAFEEDRYFFQRALQFIVEYPGQWVGLIAAKVFSVLTGREFLRPEDVYFYERYMALTPFIMISTHLIFILAVAGILFSLRDFKRWILFYLFLVASLILMFFQIKTRYLMPAIPFYIVFAAVGIYKLYINSINRKWGRVLIALSVILGLNVISLINPLGLKNPGVSEVYYAIAKNYMMRADYGKALEYFKATLVLNPKSISALNDLGMVYLNTGQYQEAIIWFEKAISIDPQSRYPQLNRMLCLDKIRQQYHDLGKKLTVGPLP